MNDNLFLSLLQNTPSDIVIGNDPYSPKTKDNKSTNTIDGAELFNSLSTVEKLQSKPSEGISEQDTSYNEARYKWLLETQHESAPVGDFFNSLGITAGNVVSGVTSLAQTVATPQLNYQNMKVLEELKGKEEAANIVKDNKTAIDKIFEPLHRAAKSADTHYRDDLSESRKVAEANKEIELKSLEQDAKDRGEDYGFFDSAGDTLGYYADNPTEALWQLAQNADMLLPAAVGKNAFNKAIRLAERETRKELASTMGIEATKELVDKALDSPSGRILFQANVAKNIDNARKVGTATSAAQIMAMEGGTTGHDVYMRIMDMPIEQLYKENPELAEQRQAEYDRLTNGRILTSEQKEKIANDIDNNIRTSLASDRSIAATAIAGSAALAIGKATGGLQASANWLVPSVSGSGNHVVNRVLPAVASEFFEEGMQNPTTGLVSDALDANSKTDPLNAVQRGREAGEGAALGLAMGGTMAAVGSPLKTVAGTLDIALRPISATKALIDRKAIQKEDEDEYSENVANIKAKAEQILAIRRKHANASTESTTEGETDSTDTLNEQNDVVLPSDVLDGETLSNFNAKELAEIHNILIEDDAPISLEDNVTFQLDKDGNETVSFSDPKAREDFLASHKNNSLKQEQLSDIYNALEEIKNSEESTEDEKLLATQFLDSMDKSLKLIQDRTYAASSTALNVALNEARQAKQNNEDVVIDKDLVEAAFHTIPRNPEDVQNLIELQELVGDNTPEGTNKTFSEQFLQNIQDAHFEATYDNIHLADGANKSILYGWQNNHGGFSSAVKYETAVKNNNKTQAAQAIYALNRLIDLQTRKLAEKDSDGNPVKYGDVRTDIETEIKLLSDLKETLANDFNSVFNEEYINIPNNVGYYNKRRNTYSNNQSTNNSGTSNTNSSSSSTNTSTDTNVSDNTNTPTNTNNTNSSSNTNTANTVDNKPVKPRNSVTVDDYEFTKRKGNIEKNAQNKALHFLYDSMAVNSALNKGDTFDKAEAIGKAEALLNAYRLARAEGKGNEFLELFEGTEVYEALKIKNSTKPKEQTNPDYQNKFFNNAPMNKLTTAIKNNKNSVVDTIDTVIENRFTGYKDALQAAREKNAGVVKTNESTGSTQQEQVDQSVNKQEEQVNEKPKVKDESKPSEQNEQSTEDKPKATTKKGKKQAKAKATETNDVPTENVEQEVSTPTTESVDTTPVNDSNEETVVTEENVPVVDEIPSEDVIESSTEVSEDGVEITEEYVPEEPADYVSPKFETVSLNIDLDGIDLETNFENTQGSALVTPVVSESEQTIEEETPKRFKLSAKDKVSSLLGSIAGGLFDYLIKNKYSTRTEAIEDSEKNLTPAGEQLDLVTKSIDEEHQSYTEALGKIGYTLMYRIRNRSQVASLSENAEVLKEINEEANEEVNEETTTKNKKPKYVFSMKEVGSILKDFYEPTKAKVPNYVLKQNIAEALAVAVLDYLGENSNSLRYRDTKSIQLTANLGDNIPSLLTAQAFRSGAVRSTMAKSVGAKALRMLGLRATGESDMLLQSFVESALGTIAVSSLLDTNPLDLKYNTTVQKRLKEGKNAKEDGDNLEFKVFGDDSTFTEKLAVTYFGNVELLITNLGSTSNSANTKFSVSYQEDTEIVTKEFEMPKGSTITQAYTVALEKFGINEKSYANFVHLLEPPVGLYVQDDTNLETNESGTVLSDLYKARRLMSTMYGSMLLGNFNSAKKPHPVVFTVKNKGKSTVGKLMDEASKVASNNVYELNEGVYTVIKRFFDKYPHQLLKVLEGKSKKGDKHTIGDIENLVNEGTLDPASVEEVFEFIDSLPSVNQEAINYLSSIVDEDNKTFEQRFNDKQQELKAEHEAKHQALIDASKAKWESNNAKGIEDLNTEISKATSKTYIKKLKNRIKSIENREFTPKEIPEFKVREFVSKFDNINPFSCKFPESSSSSNGRSTGSGLNPKSNTLMRILMRPDHQKTTIEMNNELHKAGLALAIFTDLDMDVSTKIYGSDTDIQKGADKVAAEALVNSLDALVKGIKNKNNTEYEDLRDALAIYKELEDPNTSAFDTNIDLGYLEKFVSSYGAASVGVFTGLQALSSYIDAIDSKAETLEVQIGVQVDGVTNGLFFGLLNFMAAKNQEDMVNLLNMVGIMFEDQQSFMEYLSDPDNPDAYTKLAQEIEKYLNSPTMVGIKNNTSKNVLRFKPEKSIGGEYTGVYTINGIIVPKIFLPKYAEGDEHFYSNISLPAVQIREATQSLIFFLKGNPTSNDPMSIGYFTRNLTKDPLMVWLYGAGILSIANKYGKTITSAIDRMIIKYHNEPDVEKKAEIKNNVVKHLNNLIMFDEMRNKIDSFDALFNEDHYLTLTNEKTGTKYKALGNPVGTTLEQQNIDFIVKLAIEATLAPAVKSAFTSVFGDHREHADMFTDIVNKAADVFGAKVEHEIEKLKEKQDFVTVDDYKGILESLDDFAPKGNPVEDFEQIFYKKEKRVDEDTKVAYNVSANTRLITSKGVSTTKDFKQVVSLFVEIITNSKASALPRSIHFRDAMVQAMLMLSAKNTPINIYDANVMNVTDVFETSKLTNEAAFDVGVNSQNLYDEVVRLVPMLKDEGLISSVEAKIAEILHIKSNINRQNLIDSKISISQYNAGEEGSFINDGTSNFEYITYIEDNEALGDTLKETSTKVSADIEEAIAVGYGASSDMLATNLLLEYVNKDTQIISDRLFKGLRKIPKLFHLMKPQVTNETIDNLKANGENLVVIMNSDYFVGDTGKVNPMYESLEYAISKKLDVTIVDTSNKSDTGLNIFLSRLLRQGLHFGVSASNSNIVVYDLTYNPTINAYELKGSENGNNIQVPLAVGTSENELLSDLIVRRNSDRNTYVDYFNKNAHRVLKGIPSKNMIVATLGYVSPIVISHNLKSTYGNNYDVQDITSVEQLTNADVLIVGSKAEYADYRKVLREANQKGITVVNDEDLKDINILPNIVISQETTQEIPQDLLKKKVQENINNLVNKKLEGKDKQFSEDLQNAVNKVLEALRVINVGEGSKVTFTDTTLNTLDIEVSADGIQSKTATVHELSHALQLAALRLPRNNDGSYTKNKLYNHIIKLKEALDIVVKHESELKGVDGYETIKIFLDRYSKQKEDNKPQWLTYELAAYSTDPVFLSTMDSVLNSIKENEKIKTANEDTFTKLVAKVRNAISKVFKDMFNFLFGDVKVKDTNYHNFLVEVARLTQENLKGINVITDIVGKYKLHFESSETEQDNSPDVFNGVEDFNYMFDALSEQVERPSDSHIYRLRLLSNSMFNTGVLESITTTANYDNSKSSGGYYNRSRKEIGLNIRLEPNVISSFDLSPLEVLVHEYTHAYVDYLKQEHSKIYEELVSSFEHVAHRITPEDFLQEGEDLEDANNTYSYIFNTEGLGANKKRTEYINAEVVKQGFNNIDEFIVYALTNERTIKAIDKASRRHMDNDDMTTYDKLVDKTTTLLDKAFTNPKSRKIGSNSIFKLATNLKNTRNRANIIVKGSKELDKAVNKVDEYVKEKLGIDAVELFNKYEKDKRDKVKAKAAKGRKIKVSDTRMNPLLKMIRKPLSPLFQYTPLAEFIAQFTNGLQSFESLHRLVQKSKNLVDSATNKAIAAQRRLLKDNLEGITPKEDEALGDLVMTADLGALHKWSNNFDELVNVVIDENYRNKVIADLEQSIQNRFIAKKSSYNFATNSAKQLANFMVNGSFLYEASTYYNVEQIVDQLVSDKSISEDQINSLVNDLDVLTSLYAINYSPVELPNSLKTSKGKVRLINAITIQEALQTATKDNLDDSDNSILSSYRKGYTVDTYEDDNILNVKSSEYELAYGESAVGSLKLPHLPPLKLVKGKSSELVPWLAGAVVLTNTHSKGIVLSDYIKDSAEYDHAFNHQNTKFYQGVANLKHDNPQKAVTQNKLTPVMDSEGNPVDYRYILPRETKSKGKPSYSFKTVVPIVASSSAKRKYASEINTEIGNELASELTRFYAEGFIKEFEELKTTDERYLLMPNVIKEKLKERADYLKIKGSKDGTRIFVRKATANSWLGFRKWDLRNYGNMSKEQKDQLSSLAKMAYGVMNTLFVNKVGIGFADYWTNLVASGKESVVIRTGVVTLANNISNAVLLTMQNVPMHVVVKELGKAYSDTFKYLTIEERIRKNTAKLYNVGITDKERLVTQARIAADKKLLETSPVAVLMDEGMYSTIVEDTNLNEKPSDRDIALTLAKQLNKLPKEIRAEAKEFMLTHDSTSFKLLRDFAQISDFAARKVLYDYQTKVENISHSEALHNGLITFINYNLLSTPIITTLSDWGLLHFTNYLFRSQQVLLKSFVKSPTRFISTLALGSLLDVESFVPTGSIINVGDIGSRVTTPFDVLEYNTQNAYIEALFSIFD